MDNQEKNTLLTLKQYYVGQVDYFSKKLDAVNILLEDVPAAKNAEYTSKPTTHKSLRVILLELFADGQPRTSRELMEYYNKVTGKNKDIRGFSGMLSPLINNDKKFSSYEIAEYPISRRRWYCLSEWFDE